jgi:hypothetical protein
VCSGQLARTSTNPTDLEVNNHVSLQWSWGLWDSNWWSLGSKPRAWPVEPHSSGLKDCNSWYMNLVPPGSKIILIISSFFLCCFICCKIYVRLLCLPWANLNACNNISSNQLSLVLASPKDKVIFHIPLSTCLARE